MPEDRPVEPNASASDAAGDLTQFIAVVSHELRTPLGAFLTTIELLGETDLDDRQRDYLATLKEAAESGLVLTDLLLSLRRDAVDNIDVAAFEPGDVLRSVAALMSPLAARKGLGLTVRIAPGADRSVIGPAAALRQAVTALLDNALKYTVSGDVEIDAEIETGGDGLILRVAVSDSGPGIGASERERIFNAFERGASSGAVSSGYGLGLWITQQITDRAGGSLSVDAAAIGGARFAVDLPVRDAEVSSDDDTPASGAGEPDDRLVGRRVLVVDDSAISRRLIAACLDGFGIDYVLASSGRQALDALDGETYDAVLLDIHMPDMSGFDVARRIAEMMCAESLPVVGLSADKAATCDQQLAGFTDVIAKPFQPVALYRALSGAIDNGCD